MASTPCAYLTAPSSPNEYSRGNTIEFYYSAATSPIRKAGYGTTDDHPGWNLDEFEFETSKRWLSDDMVSFDTSECPPSGGGCGQRREATMQKYRERADSLPAIAFADELFVNGLVMPLKLPPRLDFNSFIEKSPVSSPKSPRRGRRSRSYSPFRAISRSCSDVDSSRQELPKGNSSPMEEAMQVPVPPPSHSGPLDFKGSAYARFVRDQAKQGLSPKNTRPFLSVQRVRPLKMEHEGVDMPAAAADTKMEVVKYKKPSFGLCLSSQVRSP